MSGGISLLRVDEMGKFGWVAQEEDRRVIGHHIPIAIFCAKLDAEASRVASKIVRAGFATDRREADGDGTLFASLAENVGLTDVIHGLGTFESTMGATAFGVDDALGNPLTVEMGEEVDQVEILQQKRTIAPLTLCLVGMGHWDAIAGGVDGFL